MVTQKTRQNEEAEMKTNPGDVVRYKASGLKMVVVRPDRNAASYEDRWECSWISDGRRHYDSFFATEFDQVLETGEGQLQNAEPAGPSQFQNPPGYPEGGQTCRPFAGRKQNL